MFTLYNPTSDSDVIIVLLIFQNKIILFISFILLPPSAAKSVFP